MVNGSKVKERLNFAKYRRATVFRSVYRSSFFCDCDIVKPIWKDLVELIRDKHDSNFTISSFDQIFGIQDDKFLTYLFLCMKYYLYVCKFQSKRPNFTNLIVFIKNSRDTKYYIAKKYDKLSLHFKKWRFDL